MTGSKAHRGDYKWFSTIALRCMDNDVYGHVSHVVYYSLFDTAVNGMLIENDLLDVVDSPAIGLVVEPGCTYHAPLSVPDQVTAAVSVARIGTSSVRYDVALFGSADNRAAATGHFVQVYVDRNTRRPVQIPDRIRTFLASPPRGAEEPT